MNKYDILKDTWIYQEIQQQIINEQQQQHLEEQQHLLLEIVRARFPRLESLARKTMECVNTLSSLQTLLVCIGTARSEKEVRCYLAEAAQTFPMDAIMDGDDNPI
ncbi:MAG TPA: hypothetical protein VH593_14175 [Ktedonobacteraceae bacterium]